MKPILFLDNSTIFTTNGIGRLSDVIECRVVEEQNGIYELEMLYPMDGAYYDNITIRSIIVAKPSANATNQPFRVYKISRPINGKVKIYAQHISYDLSKNTCMPFSYTASSSACNQTLQALKANAVETCPFTFWTNVTTVASYTQKTPASIKQRLGGIEGSVLDQFGGEYEYDNFTVKLWSRRGSNRDITLRYGKNITDLEQEENIANTVTGIVPYWTDIDNTTTVTLPEKAVYSSHASQYSHAMTVPVDFSQEWQDAPTQSQLRARAQVYVNDASFGIPTVSTKVSFVNLPDTEEYKDLLPLQNVNLCDTINVQFEKLGIDTTAKIVKTEYDAVAERYISLEVGSLRSNLASTITDIEKEGLQAISASEKRVFANIDAETQELIDNATSWLTASGGIIRALKNSNGEWTDLLCMSETATAYSGNVLRINKNGIGFSSTGWNGTFTQAWTLDGKLVVGGTNVPSITCYDNNNNIIFQTDASGVQVNKGDITLKDINENVIFKASASGMLWNASNSSMDSTGKITANNAVINGTITSNQTVYRNNVQHTRTATLTGGGVAFKYDGADAFEIKASSTQKAELIGTRDIYVESYGFSLETTDNFILQTSDQYQYIGTSGDFDLNIKASYGTLYLSCDKLNIGDNQSGSDGYDGDLKGLHFVHGICTGLA